MKLLKLIPAALITGLLLLPATRAAGADPVGNAALTQPVKTVMTNYVKIHTALAANSTTGVADWAKAISTAAATDSAKTLPAGLAKQADKLAAAKDLPDMREAFKPLSASLINYLADHDVQTAGWTEIYCPMADASWLQKKGTDTENPYYGTGMLTCGTPKRTF